MRRLFHGLRSHAIENFNGQFKAIFDISRPVPTRGLRATRRLLLGAVLVYQLALLHRHQIGEPLRVGLKPFLQAAWFMTRCRLVGHPLQSSVAD